MKPNMPYNKTLEELAEKLARQEKMYCVCDDVPHAIEKDCPEAGWRRVDDQGINTIASANAKGRHEGRLDERQRLTVILNAKLLRDDNPTLKAGLLYALTVINKDL